jgi:hypothetical protein
MHAELTSSYESVDFNYYKLVVENSVDLWDDTGNFLSNLYLSSFMAFLEMDIAVFQINMQQCNNFQLTFGMYCKLLYIDHRLAIQCFPYKLILFL